MRNTYKYTKLYSGGTPEFIEGDVFRTVVPLTSVAVEKVGPQERNPAVPQDTPKVAPYDTLQVAPYDKILAFCIEPRSKTEIMKHCGYKDTKNFVQKYMRPLLDRGILQMTIPEKPRSKNQKYITVDRQ